MNNKIQIKNDQAKLEKLLGSKLYSSQYSFIQEIAQNATDSMRRAGKHDQSIDSGIDRDENGDFFFIRDYGVSFENKEEYVKYCCTLLESSKSQNKDDSENQEMGSYGIGKISMSAYNNIWYYEVYKNKKRFDSKVWEIEHKGIFHKESEYLDTEEEDGVLFKIYINYEKAKKESINSNHYLYYNNRNLKEEHLHLFIKEIDKKLCYFENINFTICPEIVIEDPEILETSLMSNNLTRNIYKHPMYHYSSANRETKLHIIRDQYVYLLKDEDICKITENSTVPRVPVGLKFNMNEVDVNSTREEIIRDSKFYEVLKSKLINFQNFVLASWKKERENEINTEYTNFTDYYKAVRTIENNEVSLIENVLNVSVASLNMNIEKNSYFPTVKNILEPSIIFNNKVFDKLFRFHSKITPQRSVLTNYQSYYYLIKDESVIFYRIDKTLSKYEKEKLRLLSSQTKKDVIVFAKNDFYIDNIVSIKQNKDVIETYQNLYLSTKFTREVEDFDSWFDKILTSDLHNSMEIFLSGSCNKERLLKLFPKELKEVEKKVKEKKEIKKTDLTYKNIRKAEIIRDNSSHYVADICTTARGDTNDPNIYFYMTYKTTQEYKNIFPFLTILYSILNKNIRMSKTNTRRMYKIIAINEKETIPKTPNFINLKLDTHTDNERFLKVTKKYFTSSIINNLIKEKRNIFKNSWIIKKYISNNLGEEIESLKNYINQYPPNSIDTMNKDVYEEILNYLVMNKLYDHEIYHIYEKIKNFIIKNESFLSFLDLSDNVLRESSYVHSKDLTINPLFKPLLQTSCRYLKLKMDWQHYKLNTEFFNLT